MQVQSGRRRHFPHEPGLHPRLVKIQNVMQYDTIMTDSWSLFPATAWAVRKNSEIVTELYSLCLPEGSQKTDHNAAQLWRFSKLTALTDCLLSQFHTWPTSCKSTCINHVWCNSREHLGILRQGQNLIQISTDSAGSSTRIRFKADRPAWQSVSSNHFCQNQNIPECHRMPTRRGNFNAHDRWETLKTHPACIINSILSV